jgi:hypothetical protein
LTLLPAAMMGAFQRGGDAPVYDAMVLISTVK